MKILFRLLAWVGVFLLVKGLPRDLELVTQVMPATAANPYLYGRATGELVVSLVILVLTIGFARMSMRKRTTPAMPKGLQKMPGTGSWQLPMTLEEELALARPATGRPERSGMSVAYRLTAWYLCASGLYGVFKDGNTLVRAMTGGSKAVSETLPETLGKLTFSLLSVVLAIVLARLGSRKTPARPAIVGR